MTPDTANEIALVTANFGGIDELWPLPDHPGIDAFYYTDQATRSEAEPAAVSSWTEVVVPDYPRHDFVPRLRARYFKHQIHRLEEVAAHRWLVWADSSLQFNVTDFILDQVERLRDLPPRSRILVIPHPERDTVREEYDFIRDEMEGGNQYLRVRYEEERLPEQMAYFVRRGWNLEAPLWCGTFWIIENSELLGHVWDDWWDQNLRYGLMDQLSLPILLEEHGCQPETLDISLRRNDYFSKMSHLRNM